MPRWSGLHAAPEHRSARWKSGRWRPKPSVVGSPVNQSNSHESAHRTIERVARESYGRLVAYLSVHTHDLASAEDALSEGLVAALKTWPRDGVPQNPEIEPEGVSNYQPYWAARAHRLQRLGKTREASDVYDRAIGLAEDPAVRDFLLQKRG